MQGKFPFAPSPSETAQGYCGRSETPSRTFPVAPPPKIIAQAHYGPTQKSAFSPFGTNSDNRGVTKSAIDEFIAGNVTLDASKPDGDAAGAGINISPAIPPRWSGHARKQSSVHDPTVHAGLPQPNAAGNVPPETTPNAVHALDDVHASGGTIPSHHGKSEAPPQGTLLTFVSDKD